jgi:uncharacterized protein YkwD
MVSIFKGLAALIAVVTVNLGGAHVVVPIQHSHAAPKAAADATTDPIGSDAFQMRGRTQFTVFPPTPAPDQTPAETPAENQPLAQLPIAAPAPAPRPAPPAIVVGSTQQALINQDRAGAGLGPLTWSSCLAGIAYQNALRMANAGAISHAGGDSQDLGCGIGQQGGENVGYWSGGINDPQLNTMFMNSAGHRANIMGPYHYVGTSWVVAKNGYGYIAEEFS